MATGQTKFSVPQGRASDSGTSVRSAWHGAAPWCVEMCCLRGGSEVHLSYSLQGRVLYPSGPRNKHLGTLDKWSGNSRWAYPGVFHLYRCVCSGHVCRYFEHSLPDVSGVASFLNQSVVTDWQRSWLTRVVSLCFIDFILS